MLVYTGTTMYLFMMIHPFHCALGHISLKIDHFRVFICSGVQWLSLAYSVQYPEAYETKEYMGIP